MSQSSALEPSRSLDAPAGVPLDEERNDLIWDLDEVVLEVEMTFFCENLLPRLPLPHGQTVSHVVERLKDSGEITEDEETGYCTWKGWKTPSSSDLHEDKVFAPFAGVTKAIQDAINLDSSPAIRFYCNTTITPTFETRNGSSKPDCFGVRSDKAECLATDPSMKPHWMDVAIPGEFKECNPDSDFGDVSTSSSRY